jgi:hypothetical protein
MEPGQILTSLASHAAQIAAWAADKSGDGLGSHSDEMVLSTLVTLEEVARLTGAAQVHVAAIVEERTDVGGLSDGLAFRYGFSRAVPLIEHLTRVSEAEARRRVRLGKNVRPHTSMTGEVIPARYPEVAKGLENGSVSPAVADRIIGGIEQACRNHVTGEDEQPGEFEENVAAAEKSLVEAAGREPADCVSGEVNLWRDALDPDGAPLRDEDVRARRGLWRSKERNGVTKWTWNTTGITTVLLDGFLADARAANKPRFVPTEPKNLLDPDGITLATPEESVAMLSGNMLDGVNDTEDPQNAEGAGGTAGTNNVGDCQDRGVVTHIKDTRTPAQRDNDVLDGYLRAGARASENELGSIRDVVEVIAIATVADLEAGRGVGWIQGLEEPVSIEFIKEAACTSGYRLVVQGDDGEVLWMGPRPRRFDDTQKRAIIVRDGPTCVSPGCNKPARQTDVHHVEFHSHGGPTDAENGVLLCSEHHHMIHKSPFQIEMHNGKPFMLAPRWLDPKQTWKPLGHPKYRNRPNVHERPDWETTLGN